MSTNSKIEWTDSTFNPWIGCTMVGPGCDHCYAEADFDRRKKRVKWGAGNARSRTAPANWKKPLQWNAQPFYECRACGKRGDERDMNEFLPCACRHEARTTTRRRVFCASLADVFDNEVDPVWRADLFRLVGDTPKLDWLLLTKRVGNAQKMLEACGYGYSEGAFGNRLAPLPRNIWLGATVVNQEEADRDIPKLLALPARIRFLSCEPLLGALQLDRWLWRVPRSEILEEANEPSGGPGLDWVIVGGESGQHARPMRPDWVRSLRDQCDAAGVPFLFKQWGEWGPLEQNRGLGWKLGDERTGFFDDEGWHHMGVSSHGPHMLRVGKKTAGRLLDGRNWDQFP